MRQGLRDLLLRSRRNMVVQEYLVLVAILDSVLLGCVDATACSVLEALGAATVYVLDACRVHNLADRDALLGERMQHLENEALDRRRIDETEEFATLRVAIRSVGDLAVGVRLQPLVPAFLEGGIVLVICFGGLPGASAKGHGQEDDGAGPDVEGPWIVLAILRKHLGGDVGETTTDTGLREAGLAHILATLSAGFPKAGMFTTEDFSNTKIGDLEVAILVQEQILEFDVAVRYTVRMKVINAAKQLLEEA